MRLIIHDLTEADINKFKFNKDDKIISTINCNNNCIGCFSCWIKHPTKCIHNDIYSNIVDYLKITDEFIIISKSRYGCYSKEIKQVLERCIGYVLPYFTIRKNKVHHKTRYKNKLNFTTFFYGDITKEDKKCLYDLTKANSINLNTNNFNVICENNIEEIYNVYFN